MRKILLSILTLFVAMGSQLPLAKADSALTLSGASSFGTSCLYQDGPRQAVIKYYLTNTTAGAVDVSEFSVHYTGTAAQSEFGIVRFYDDPNSTFLGSTNFDFVNKVATISGAPIISIPAGEVREITVYVNVKATAVLNRTARFQISAGDVVNTGGDLSGTVPYLGSSFKICAPQVLAGPTEIFVLSPNGGEVLTKGELATVSWVTKNAPYNSYVRNVELIRAGQVVQVLDLITTPRTLPGSLLRSSQVARFIVPDVATANNYKIRVRLYRGPSDNPNQLDVDVSDANFRIE